MNEAQKKPRSPRKNLDFDSEIAAAEAKLKSLQAAKKEKEKRELAEKRESEKREIEKNFQEIFALLVAENLEFINVEIWRKVLPQMHDLLVQEQLASLKKAKPDAVEYQEFQAAA